MDKNIFTHEDWCDSVNNISTECNCLIGYPLEVIEEKDERIKELEEQNDSLRMKLNSYHDGKLWQDNEALKNKLAIATETLEMILPELGKSAQTLAMARIVNEALEKTNQGIESFSIPEPELLKRRIVELEKNLFNMSNDLSVVTEALERTSKAIKTINCNEKIKCTLHFDWVEEALEKLKSPEKFTKEFCKEKPEPFKDEDEQEDFI